MARLTHVVQFCRARVIRFAVLAAAFGLLDVASTAAQPESPRFTRLSVEHGLSQSSVLQILQDRKGLIWFATQEGLNRYDGYRFTVHRARDRQGFLRDHDINALIEDAHGNLWVGTSLGLYRYDLDTGRFETCASPVDRPRHRRTGPERQRPDLLRDVLTAGSGRSIPRTPSAAHAR